MQDNTQQIELPSSTKGYVIITCSEPDWSGNMQVDMQHDGDPALIAYLLKSALQQLED